MITAMENDYRSGFSSLYALEEAVRLWMERFCFPPFSPFIDRFNEKIHDLHSSGLIGHWEINFYGNRKGLIRKPEDIGPQVLTMEHLEVCFLICFLPLIFGTIAFAGEVGGAWLKKRFLKIWVNKEMQDLITNKIRKFRTAKK